MSSKPLRPSSPKVLTLAFAFALTGCVTLVYVKSGATDDQVRLDLAECTDIARQQAFRDQPSLQFHLGLSYGSVHHGHRHPFARHQPSYAEVQHRYRSVCMIARGYELARLQDQ